MICASITESLVNEMVKTANSTHADIVEIRLDYLKEFEGIEKLKEIRKPLIATCMPKWEGGKFKGSEDERISILQDSIKFSDYISIELRTKADLRNKIINEARENSVRVIVSYHDFEKTPDEEEILEILKNEKEAGGDIVKIAFMPKDYGDVLRTMKVLVENKLEIPIIAISLGELGKISRILGHLFGSYMTFASPGKGKESAPGQLTVDELKKVFDILE